MSLQTNFGEITLDVMFKRKTTKEFPFEYRSHMFKLHKHYIDELRVDGGRVDKLFVITILTHFL